MKFVLFLQIYKDQYRYRYRCRDVVYFKVMWDMLN